MHKMREKGVKMNKYRQVIQGAVHNRALCNFDWRRRPIPPLIIMNKITIVLHFLRDTLTTRLGRRFL